MRRLELELLFWASRAALIFILPPFISDVGLYEEYAKKVLIEGHWPYKHFHFEYPPLAFPLLLVPGVVTRLLGLVGTEYFRMAFGLLLLPFDYYLFRSFKLRPPFPGAGFAYVLLVCAMGLLAYDRFDLTVGFVLAFPFLAQLPSDRRFGISFGLGGALKLVPLSLAPLPLLRWEGWGRGATWLRFLKYSLWVVVPVFLSCALAWLLSGGKVAFLAHHTGRGVQIESFVGSLVMAAQAFFALLDAGVRTNFGGQHLGESAGAVGASRVLFYGSLVFTYAFLWWERRRYGTLASAWLVISGFVTFGYVLSPQFLLWLIPLGLLAAGEVPAGWRRGVWISLFGAAVALTGVHFRYYWSYVNLNHLSVAAVVGRNLALAALWALSWKWLKGDKK